MQASYWELDYNRQCFVGQHLVLTATLGICGLLLFRWDTLFI